MAAEETTEIEDTGPRTLSIDDFDFSDEKETEAGPSLDELKKQLAAEQAKNGMNAEMLATIQNLAQRPVQVQAPVLDQPVQKPRESDADFKARQQKWEEGFFASPASHIESKLEEKLTPIMGQVLTLLQAQDEEIVRLKPETAKIVERYGDEVKTAAKKYGVDPRAFTKAVSEVKAAHAEDLAKEGMEDAIQKGVAEALKKMGLDPAKLANGGNPAKPFVETGGAYGGAAAGKTKLPVAAKTRYETLRRVMNDSQALEIVMEEFKTDPRK